jgi:hypothetical protein
MTRDLPVFEIVGEFVKIPAAARAPDGLRIGLDEVFVHQVAVGRRTPRSRRG